ncbi:synaptosomal-associated protein 25 [Hyalella azteca]|uniref:Synaptosomal-associated protein n=1 Tax=Hyalella azteca TaxID=294128 RepID=A0A8B7NMP9_HYAAZ|nr:synaptosomal-associated protein 25 [Hyalella azteca]
MTKKEVHQEEEAPVQRSELEQLQYDASRVTNESLESTRRMLSLCEDSKEAGIRTLVALDDQGEQLDRIEEGMDQINADMKEAEKNLSGMEGCCGLCVLPCQKSAQFKEESDPWKDKGDGVVNSQPQRLENQVMLPCPQVGRITKDALEDEMEENLGQVNTMMDNLRNMAIDMGSEIDNQNRQLARLDAKAASNEGRIKVANDRAGNLLKSA